MAGDDRPRVGRHRVEAGGQVEYLAWVPAERPGQPGAVAAVGAGRGDGQRHLGPDRVEQQARHHRPAAAAAAVTSRLRRIGPVDVGDSGRRPEAEGGATLGAAAVHVEAAQAHPEGGREGRLGHPGVGRGVAGGLVPDRGQHRRGRARAAPRPPAGPSGGRVATRLRRRRGPAAQPKRA